MIKSKKPVTFSADNGILILSWLTIKVLRSKLWNVSIRCGDTVRKNENKNKNNNNHRLSITKVIWAGHLTFKMFISFDVIQTFGSVVISHLMVNGYLRTQHT